MSPQCKSDSKPAAGYRKWQAVYPLTKTALNNKLTAEYVVEVRIVSLVGQLNLLNIEDQRHFTCVLAFHVFNKQQ